MKKNILIFIYLLVSIFIIGCLYGFPKIGIDDANIYFVYMKNFADGKGFVYNVGSESVEGFTSILWTLIGSFIFIFTNHIEICLLIINVVLLFFTLKIAIKIIELFIKDEHLSANYITLFLGFLVVFPGFYDWTVLSLLETGLWTFELVLFTYLLIVPYLNNNFSFQKSTIIISLLFPFFIITRPESILIGLVFIAIRVLQLFLEKISFRKILIHTIPMCVVFIISLIALTKWRLYYFGYPFPNTYYVKMSDGFLNNLFEGAIYFGKYVSRTNPLIIAFFVLIFIWFIKMINEKDYTTTNKIIFSLVIISLVGIGIPFYTGGDHFRMSRFYQAFSPIFHLCFLFLMLSFSHQNKLINKITSSRKKIFLSILILSFLPLKSLYVLFVNNKYSIAIEFDIANENRKLGNNLNSFFDYQKKPSVGVIAAGGFAYTYNGYVNDVLGLNNIEVAHTINDRPKDILKGHRAFNKTVFLKQKPDLFLFEFVADTSKFIPFTKRDYIVNGFGGKVIRHIYNDTDFKKQYSPVFITNKKAKQTLFAYASKQFLSTLDTTLYVYKNVK